MYIVVGIANIATYNLAAGTRYTTKADKGTINTAASVQISIYAIRLLVNVMFISLYVSC